MVNSYFRFCGQKLKAQVHLSQTPFWVFLFQTFVFSSLLWHQQIPSGNSGIVLANNTCPASPRPQAWHWREQLCLSPVSLERQTFTLAEPFCIGGQKVPCLNHPLFILFYIFSCVHLLLPRKPLQTRLKGLSRCLSPSAVREHHAKEGKQISSPSGDVPTDPSHCIFAF